MAQLTMSEKIWIEVELSLGRKKNDIAKELGVSRSTVYNFIERLESDLSTTEIYTRKKSIGHPKLTKQDLVNIEQYVLDHPFHVNRIVLSNLGLNITERSMANYLTKLGFSTCLPPKKTLLNQTDIRNRLNWSIEHLNWMQTSWRKVIFCDQCTFENSVEGKRPAKRKHNENDRIKRNFFGLMIYNQPVQLFECTDAMSADEFNELMNRSVLPAISTTGLSDFVLQMDSEKMHSDSIQHLQSLGYQFISWPDEMYDLNIFENIWTIVRRKKNGSLKQTISHQVDFDNGIKQIVKDIPISTVNNLFDSMPNRVQMLQQNGGKRIKL